MRSMYCLILLIVLALTACQKQDHFAGFSEEPVGSASDRGKGNANNQGLITTTVPSSPRLVGGDTMTIGVFFKQPAPSGGWTIVLTSNDPSVQVPQTYFVPEGATEAHPVVTSTAVTSGKTVFYTVILAGQTVANTIKVYPVTATFYAPPVAKPSNGAKVRFGTNLLFDWLDHSDAWENDLQVSLSPTFELPVVDVRWPDGYYVTNSLVANTYYWRVRYVDASGNPGPWSEVRSFTVKP